MAFEEIEGDDGSVYFRQVTSPSSLWESVVYSALEYTPRMSDKAIVERADYLTEAFKTRFHAPKEKADIVPNQAQIIALHKGDE